MISTQIELFHEAYYPVSAKTHPTVFPRIILICLIKSDLIRFYQKSLSSIKRKSHRILPKDPLSSENNVYQIVGADCRTKAM